MTKKIRINGVIIPNDYKWIYDLFEVDATCPADVNKIIDTANGEDLEIEINSPGGDVYSGSDIYTTLMGYKGRVTIDIVGVAASAASIISMSGRPTRISPTAQIMIHNVMSAPFGDHRVLEHEAEVLKNYNISMANAYRLKTGLSQEELLDLMSKGGSANGGTWLNAQQAKEKGFVDEIMFDTNNRLAASINTDLILTPEIINKLRNLIPPKKPGEDTSLYQARLNLLKIKGGQVND
jgi:ATP-dependent Clp protease protease subunit